jgi:hypothetical protein
MRLEIPREVVRMFVAKICGGLLEAGTLLQQLYRIKLTSFSQP